MKMKGMQHANVKDEKSFAFSKPIDQGQVFIQLLDKKKFTNPKPTIQMTTLRTWSKGQTFRWRFARQVLQTECPQPRLMGKRVLSSNPFSQTGQIKKSVHWGVWIGILALRSFKTFKYKDGFYRRKLLSQVNVCIRVLCFVNNAKL